MEKSAAPWPLLETAIEPKSKDDQEKLTIALSKLANEDPSFRAKSDEESGLTIIAGTDELHLDMIVDRICSEFKVEANVGAPRVAYRETITGKALVDYTHKRLTHGTGQFARVNILFEHNPDGDDFAFESKIVGDAVPKEYIPGVQKGIQSVLSSGPLAGFPMLAVKATLLDGAYHDVDSSVLYFEIAARAAFREGAQKAGVQLLEPIMKVEVVAPEDYIGSVVGELNSRRGLVEGQEIRGETVVVNAAVPLANMFKLQQKLWSLSHGQALLTTSYARYAPVPFPDDPEPPPAVALRA